MPNCDPLSALTYWYETYYEVYKGGQYFRIIDEMHAKYGQDFPIAREGGLPSAYTNVIGPIVRITPNEVHFEDPDFNDVLYPSAGKKRIDRPEYAAARAGSKFQSADGWNFSAWILTSFRGFLQLLDPLLLLLSMKFIDDAETL